MNAGFDGLDVPKHERVVKALEQVNGLRYRYHAAPQEDKKLLRFESDDDDTGNEESGDEALDDKTQRRQRKHEAKDANDEPNAPALTLDDHIENLLRKTRTLAMMKLANNTAHVISSDTEDEGDEADDVVSEELSSISSMSAVSSPKNGASSLHLVSLGSISSMGSQHSGLLGTAAMRLARTLSAFLCLPRAISYIDLESITEKLLEGPHDQFDDEDYADLIDCHVDSARDDEEEHAEDDGDPIWKRRKSKPVLPLILSDDSTDLEMHQRQIFMEANRFGAISTRNLFLASSKNLLTEDDSKGSMSLDASGSRHLLGSPLNGSNSSFNIVRQGSSTTVVSTVSSDGASADPDSPFNEEEYIQWRTQVKADYLAWLNAKVEATKRRKSRAKKGDPDKKPRWLLLYEASRNPARKYQPDAKQ